MSNAPVDSLVGMHQPVRRRDSGTLHDCKEEVQKLPVYQLQRQEGDQSMQCPPLLAGVHVFQGCTLDSRVTNGWIVCLLVCLRPFKSCTSFHFCGVFCPVVCGCRVHPFCILVGGHRLSRAPSSAAGPPPADMSRVSHPVPNGNVFLCGIHLGRTETLASFTGRGNCIWK